MRRLFLAALFLAVLMTKTTPEASQSRLGTIESIVERGTYALDLSTFIHTIDKVYKDGHYYSHQPPLLSTIEAPVYWVLHLPGARFHNRARFLLTYSFTLLTNGVALGITVVVFAKLFAMASIAAPYNQLLALLLPIGTWLLPYSLVTNNHGISGMLLAVLVWLLLQIEWLGATGPRAISTGLVLGLLAAIEILPLLSFVPLAAIIVLRRRDLDARGRAFFVAALAVPLIAHAIINIQIIGDVVPAGFHTDLFRFEGSGFDEGALTGSLKHRQPADIADYMWHALFAGKGFFTFAPLCLLGVACGAIEWRWWWSRAKGPFVVMVLGSAISLVVALLTTNNLGGSSVGFRHAVYLSPVFIVLLLPWLVQSSSRAKAMIAGVAFASAVLLIAFAVPAPWSDVQWSSAALGTWDQYVPVIARIVHRDLFIP